MVKCADKDAKLQRVQLYDDGSQKKVGILPKPTERKWWQNSHCCASDSDDDTVDERSGDADEELTLEQRGRLIARTPVVFKDLNPKWVRQAASRSTFHVAVMVV